MSRTLTTATSAATAQTVTTPAFLVEIDFSTVIRLSTRNDQTWNSLTWTGGRIGKISGLQWDGKGQQTGTIEIINSDLAYSALVLNEGVADRPVKIWKFYGDNPALLDPVAVFDGVADEADIGPDAVRITLVSSKTSALYAPRRFIGPAIGFNHLRPAGSRDTWGGQTYILERV
ncbi:MAG: hypothetical protein PHG89_10760 [Gallionella sp.]|nr:hypothetical protein [Gallionella sp.]